MYFVKNEKTKTIYTSFWWAVFDEFHLEQVMAVLVVVVVVVG